MEIQMKELVIGDLIAKTPIIQGGMGIGVSMSSLASAVANEGGIGVISAAGSAGLFEKGASKNVFEASLEVLSREIKRARELTKGILGVNIMVALTNFADLVKTSIKEGIDIIFAGAGLPLNLPEYLDKKSKTKLVPIISSARAAKLIATKWIDRYGYAPDAFVIEGPKAGGHLGFKVEQIDDEKYSLENILKQVKEIMKPIEERIEKKIPIIVGGGIYSGADINKFIKLGADGVQMSTRFVPTDECDASIEFKQTYVDCKKEDIQIIVSPVGLPGRAIVNQFVRDFQEGKKHPFTCPYNCLLTCKKEESPYCIFMALLNAQKGKMRNGFAFAGANAYLVEKISPIKEVFAEIKKEYEQAINLNH